MKEAVIAAVNRCATQKKCYTDFPAGCNIDLFQAGSPAFEQLKLEIRAPPNYSWTIPGGVSLMSAEGSGLRPSTVIGNGKY